MKKDNIRDYATDAFRFYAACGQLTSEQLKQKVYAEIYSRSRREYSTRGSGMPSDSTAYAVMAAEDAVQDMAAEFMDIIAVEKTMLQLNKYQRRSVEIVYFTEPEKELKKGDISDRVHRAEMEIPASEKSIYRWLGKARGIFARERGLRVSKEK